MLARYKRSWIEIHTAEASSAPAARTARAVYVVFMFVLEFG